MERTLRDPRPGLDSICSPEPISSKTILIVAYDSKQGIGYKNDIPWRKNTMFKDEMRFFKGVTSGNAVVMGRNTYESIDKPLPGRHNVIISRTADEDVLMPIGDQFFLWWGRDLAQQVWKLQSFWTPRVFIIGGEQIYREALELNLVDEIWATELSGWWVCDTFFPIKDYEAAGWEQKSREVHKNFSYDRVVYQRSTPASLVE